LKTFIIYIIILFYIFSIDIFPSEITAQEKIDPSINILIKKVKQSSGDKRRKAMNALKLKLRTVNATTRTKTMQELRHTFARAHGQHGSGMHSMKQIPHQQMQQKMNQQHQMNAPHQSRPRQRPPNRQPGMPQQPPSGGRP
jgi:hypothetical protein